MQVPLLISLLALVGLLLLLWQGDSEAWTYTGDENGDLVRAMRFSKAKKSKAL